MKLKVVVPLVLLGAAVLLFLMPTNTVKLECAAKGQVNSGFVDPDQNCPVTQASYQAWQDQEAKPKITRLGAIGCVVLAPVSFGLLHVATRRRQPA